MGGDSYPWTHPAVLSAGVAFLVSTVILLQLESRAEKPLLHVRLLCSFPVRNILVVGFLLNMINYTASYLPRLYQ